VISRLNSVELLLQSPFAAEERNYSDKTAGLIAVSISEYKGRIHLNPGAVRTTLFDEGKLEF
jgi:hypothetical protein